MKRGCPCEKSFDQIKGAISNADAQALAQAFENYDNAASGEKGAKAAEIKTYTTLLQTLVWLRFPRMYTMMLRLLSQV